MVATVTQQGDLTSSTPAISTALSSALAADTAGGIAAGNLFGLILSPDATSTVLDISAGNCTDSTAVATITLGAFTKAIGTAWAAGTGNGALDTGAIANSTWYHVFAISKAAGASPDILVSLSATAPTLPSTYTLFRRIGSIKTNGSAQVTPFSQFADTFRWKTQVTDLNTASPGTGAQLQALTVPTGVKVFALVNIGINDSTGGNSVLITSPDDTDQVPGGTGAGPFTILGVTTAQWNNTEKEVWTNTSAQLRYHISAAQFNNLQIQTIGWRDDRGRNQ